MLQDIHKRALRRAGEIVGGNEELRIKLGATEEEFAAWRAQKDLPKAVFLKLVDIITVEEVRSVRHWRSGSTRK